MRRNNHSSPERLALVFLVLSAFALASLAAQSRGLELRQKDGTLVGSFKASYALVIGESAYTTGWPKLPGVKTDIQLVAKALSDAGFAVTTKYDLSFVDLKQAYEDFIDTYGLDEGNRLLFYYSGHGHTLKLSGGRDMGYIVPVDVPNPNIDATGFKKKAIPMEQFNTWAKRIEARHALFLFDSCFSGSIFAITRAVPDNISEKTVRAVRQFITSGSADEEVPDKSLFREQFLAALAGEADRNRDGYVTGAELGEFLDETVVNYSHKSQHPQYGKIQDPALDKGDFVFALPTAAKAAASPPVSAPTLSLAHSYGSLGITTAAAGTLYLDGTFMGDLPAGADARLDSVEVGVRSLELRYADGQIEKKSAAVQKGQATSVAFIYGKPPASANIGDMVLVKGGSFMMGSEEGSSDEKPVHQVTVSDFYIGKYEVTVGEFKAFVQSTGYRSEAERHEGGAIFANGSWGKKADASWKNPYFLQSDRNPVVLISWNDAVTYCNWRSQKEALRPAYTISGTSVSCDWSTKGYRLPTEAEWEYAARGGSVARTVKYAETDDLDQIAWYDQNSGNKTHPVGQKAPNDLGVFDMYGNVWEWCWDWYDDSYYAKSPSSEPQGGTSGPNRALRGGTWYRMANGCRSTGRYGGEPSGRASDGGFRLSRTP